MINIETLKNEINKEIEVIANNLKKQARFRNAKESQIKEYATKMYYNNMFKKLGK